MGGIFGVVARDSCVPDLFYGTDYHSHLGTRRGGLAVWSGRSFTRFIHSIENAQFRSKFEDDLPRLAGRLGIGCISDTDDQPLLISSHLGTFALVTVGRINNLKELAGEAFRSGTHFAEVAGGDVNPTELVATLVSRGRSFAAGIRLAQEAIDGSCTLLLLTAKEVYAARDRRGRTPLILGAREGAWAATMESCAFPNLGYQVVRELGPGEVVRLGPEGPEQVLPPLPDMRICAFLWIYYGYPASTYEAQNVEAVRNRCGAALARHDRVAVDLVAGIPDSGTGHALGYANEARLPYRRPFVKYTPTWPRSFMPQDQEQRDLVARMKLIPIRELIAGRRLLFCEDSIVRGTQLKETIQRLFDYGALEVHMRPACPPLIHGCRFLNFSTSKSELALAARRAIRDLDGERQSDLAAYADPCSGCHGAMVEKVREGLGLTSLGYQTIPDMVEAIGIPGDKVCTYCWNGRG